MKNSKTTIRELSAKYRSILRKCFLLNALAIGLVAATSANAAVNISVDTSGLSAGGDAVTGTATATISGLGTMAEASGADVINLISDNIKNTVYSDGLYDATADYRVDGESTLSVTAGTPTQAQYQFYLSEEAEEATNLNGAGDGSNMNKNLIAVEEWTALSGATSGTLGGDATYNTSLIARNNAELYTQATGSYKFVLGEDAEHDPTAATAAGSYQFEKQGANVSLAVAGYTLGEGQLMDDTVDLAKTGYTYQPWNYVNPGDEIEISGGAPVASSYTFTNSHGEDDDLSNYLDESGNLIVPAAEIDYAATAISHYNTDKTGYDNALAAWEGDNGNYHDAIDKYNDERGAFDSLVAAYDTYTAGYTAAGTEYNTANAEYQSAYGAYDADKTAYGTEATEYAAYNNSVQQAVDGRADDAITRALDGGAIAAADTATLNAAKDYADGLASNYDAAGAAAAVQGATTETVASVDGKVDDIVDGTTTVAKATDATNDGNGNNIVNTYATKTQIESGDPEKASIAGVADSINESDATVAGILNNIVGTIGDPDALQDLYSKPTTVTEDWTVTDAIVGVDGALQNVITGTTDIAYDSTDSGLSADTVKGAIDELAGDVDTVEDVIGDVVNGYNTTTEGSHLTAFSYDGEGNPVGDIVTNINAMDAAIIANENAIGDIAELDVPVDAETNAENLVEAANANATAIANVVSGTTDIVYDNTTSHLSAGTVKGAIDEIVTDVIGHASSAGDPAVDATGLHKTIEDGDKVLQANITAEENRAKGIESGLQTSINNIANGTTDIAYDNTTSGLSATTVKGAIDENAADIDALETLVGHKATAESEATGLVKDVEDNANAIGDMGSIKGKYLAKSSSSSVTTMAGETGSPAASDHLQALNDGLEHVENTLTSKINKLETKMEKGLAANNALAGLVPLDHLHKTQISAALGGYESRQAVAVGAFHYLNDRTLLNAGIAYGGNDSMSYKVGVTFGF